VEHHEIAGYGCARTYAKILGHKEAAKTLQTTLDEEAATDKKLTVIAEKLNLLPQEEAALKN
jgi:ferritin-like metal-binding protein YciE